MNAVSSKARPGLVRRYYLPAAFTFFLVELFSFFFLYPDVDGFTAARLWPLAFGALWAVLITSVLGLLPSRAARVGYGIAYFLSVVYAAVQTGYRILFSEMMWLTDFRYASEGADYMDVLLTYPLGWWLGLAALLAAGVLMVWKFPRWKWSLGKAAVSAFLAAAMGAGAFLLPEAVFRQDKGIRYAGSDYGRMQSAQAAYENMFNAYRLYQVCGLYQTGVKDLYAHVLYPLSPGYSKAREAARQEITAALNQRDQREDNEMTGLLAGKNVILVLMESMDDWMITEDTPNLNRLMKEGLNFTRFYTPVYGSIRTFNTEFVINTGSFLRSGGGYAFDYVTNAFPQSLPSLLRQAGYSAKTFHYNDPSFYSRGVFSEAMGYEEYVCYADYLAPGEEDKLFDENLLFDNAGLREEFFRKGQPTLNFVITRSAHLSYKYNEVLSHWALKKYPEYRGLTGNEETDCALLKARLVDDFFGRMLAELEAEGQLDNTVIIGVTDHYTYGYKNEEALLELSGVEEKLLLEKTPCFIWSPGLEARQVDKVANSADLLPTVLNLLGVDSPYRCIGSDIFDSRYQGWVPFSNGSWLVDTAAYDASAGKTIPLAPGPALTQEQREVLGRQVDRFIRINNLILDTDYYRP